MMENSAQLRHARPLRLDSGQASTSCYVDVKPTNTRVRLFASASFPSPPKSDSLRSVARPNGRHTDLGCVPLRYPDIHHTGLRTGSGRYPSVGIWDDL